MRNKFVYKLIGIIFFFLLVILGYRQSNILVVGGAGIILGFISGSLDFKLIRRPK
jgi:hypothetical protein